MGMDGKLYHISEGWIICMERTGKMGIALVKTTPFGQQNWLFDQPNWRQRTGKTEGGDQSETHHRETSTIQQIGGLRRDITVTRMFCRDSLRYQYLIISPFLLPPMMLYGTLRFSWLHSFTRLEYVSVSEGFQTDVYRSFRIGCARKGCFIVNARIPYTVCGIIQMLPRFWIWKRSCL